MGTVPIPVGAQDAPPPSPGTVALPPEATDQAGGGSLEQTALDSAKGVASGMGKGVLESVQGVERGANWAAKKLDPFDSAAHPTPQLPIVGSNVDTTAKTGAEKIGKVGENIAEWVAGDEVLKAAGALVKLPREILALAEKYPKASKMFLDVMRGATVGGAQGGVKGGEKGAKEGVAAGAAGSLAGSALAEGLRPLARILGIGGLTSEEAFTKAGRPSVADINWKDSLEKAMPVLKTLDFKDVGTFTEAVHDGAKDLWEQTIQPQVDRNAGAMIDGAPIAQLVRGAKNTAWAALPKTFGKESQAVENIAQDFDNFHFNLKDGNDFLKVLNAKLADFYNMPTSMRHAAGITDGEIAGLEKAASGLRDQVYGALASAGEETPREFREQYGALKDIGRIFGKRATVEERQSPLSMKMFLSLLAAATEMGGAFASGHPEAAVAAVAPAAVGVASTVRGTSGSLIKQGLSASGREALGEDITKSLSSPGREAVKYVTKKAAGGGATAAALPPKDPRHIRFQASDGSIHDVPQESIDQARKIDPQLKVLE